MRPGLTLDSGEFVPADDLNAALVEAQQPAKSFPITVEQVEDAIGLQSTAWDTIGAEKIVEAVLRLANAQQPSPTPQADPLQPVVNLQEQAGMYADDFAPQADSQPAPEYVGNGMFKGETIQKAAEHWANWCDVRCLTGLSEFLRVVAATPAFWTPEEIAAAKERAKKFEPWLADTDRAARAPGSQPAPAAYSGNLEQELAMLIRRIVSSARRNCEDGSNVLKLANEAWAYLVRKGLNGSPLRDAGVESDPTPPAQAADSVLEDAARLNWLQANSCDLRCIGVPTGGDDYDINWVVIEHYQAKPHEREIGRSYQDDPRAAIDEARKQGANHD